MLSDNPPTEREEAMPNKPKTWVLVADGGRARVLAARGVGQGFELVNERVMPLARTSEIGSGPPGRSYESASTARHAMEPKVDFHREQKVAFESELAGFLEAERKAGSFQRLVVVAPPTVLGNLRRLLSEPVAKTVVGEIDKDLTKIPLIDLPRHLKDAVAC
jgi:protein required for attachment to host cells